MKINFVSLLLLVSMLVSSASAQKVPTPARDDAPPVLLELSVVNRAFYLHDQPDYSLLASTPNAVFPIGVGKTFTVVTGIGDIVQMNGRPTKGTFAAWFTLLNLTPQPEPGQAIADVTRSQINNSLFEVLDTDGKSLGTITLVGWGGGPDPRYVITGGTGIFLGARGEAGELPGGIFGRPASTNEDPSLRRAHGGGTATMKFAFIRKSCPYAKGDED